MKKFLIFLALIGLTIPSIFGQVFIPRRVLAIDDAVASNGTAITRLNLHSLGDETAIGLSIAYDPELLSIDTASSPDVNADVLLGDGVPNSLQLFVNAENPGQLGVVLFSMDLVPFDSSPPDRNVLDVTFHARGSSFGTTPIAFADYPVLTKIVDAYGEELETTFLPGSVTSASTQTRQKAKRVGIY